MRKPTVAALLAVALAVFISLQMSTSQVASAQESPPKAAHSRWHVPNPPDALLMKGPIVLQKGRELTRCWTYYSKDGRSMSSGCAAYFFHSFSRWYVPLPAGGTELHIRINNPQRLKWLTFAAYTGFKPYPWDKSVGVPFGERHLGYTIRRVENARGKTVAWNVFFRLPRAESHYYLDLYTQWKAAPHAGLSFYDTWYTFHVRTF